MLGFDFELGLDTRKAEQEIDSLATTADKKLAGLTNIPVDVDLTDFQKSISDVLKTAEGIRTEFKGIKLPSIQAGNLSKEFNSMRSAAAGAINEQKNALAALITAGKKGSAEFDKLQKELIETAQKAKVFDDSMNEVNATLNEINGKKVSVDFEKTGDTSMLGGLGGGIASIAGGIGVAGLASGLGSLISSAGETEAAIAKVGAQTGLTGKALADLSTRGKELYQQGIGDSISDAIAKTGILQKTLGDTFNAKEQNEFAKTAQGIAKTYDMDFNEVIQKSRTFIKSFGLDGKQAMELISIGARDGANAEGDFFDTLNEYSPLVKTMGIDAQEFTSILTTGIQNGARNTDKLADALKETQIRIKAGDFNTAFDGLAKGATGAEKTYIEKMRSIALQAQQGKISIKDALVLSATEVTKGFEAGKISSSMRDQLLIGLSGTPAEDIGGALYGKILTGFSKDKSGFAKQGTAAADAFQKAAEPKGFEGFKRSIEGLLGTVGDMIMPILKPITEMLNNSILPALKPILEMLGGTLGKILGSVGNLIGKVFVALMPLINALMEIVDVALKPIGDIIDALTPVITELVGVLVAILVPIIKDLTPLIGDVVLIVAELVKIAAKIIVSFIQFVKWIGTAVAKMLGFNDAGEMLTVGLRMVIQVVAWLIDKVKMYYQFIYKAVEATIGFAKSVGEFLGLIDKKDGKQSKSKKSNEEYQKSQKDLSTSVVATDGSIKDLNSNLDKNKDLTDAAKKPVESLADRLARLRDGLIQAKLAGKDFTAPQVGALKELVKQSLDTEKLNVATQQVDDLVKSMVNLEATKGISLKPMSNFDKIDLTTNVNLDDSEIEGEINKTLEYVAPKLKAIEIPAPKIDTAALEALQSDYEKFGFNFDFKFDTATAEDNSDEQLNILKEQFKKGEMSYEEYIKNIDDIEKNRNSNSKNNYKDLQDIAGAAFDGMSKVMDKYINEDLTKLKDGIALLATDQISLTDFLKQNATDITTLFNNVAGSMALAAGAAIAEGENVGKAVVMQALKVAEMLMMTYAAEIFMFLSTLAPPPFGQILAGGIIAAGFALLQKAKSAIGAEDGVIGIDGGYNRRAGSTDTIPLMVAPGESVINANATRKNRRLLEHINAGGSIDNLISQNVTVEKSNIMSQKDVVNAINNLEARLQSRQVIVKDSREVVITDKRTIVKQIPYYR